MASSPHPTVAVLRGLVGTAVAVETDGVVLHGTLVSCTRNSVWLVDGDTDVVVPVPQIESVRRD